MKSRRDVHNIHEINGIFTLVQKQSCAISSVTRNSFRSGENLNFGPVGGGGGGGMLMKDSTAVHAGQLLGRCNFF